MGKFKKDKAHNIVTHCPERKGEERAITGSVGYTSVFDPRDSASPDKKSGRHLAIEDGETSLVDTFDGSVCLFHDIKCKLPSVDGTLTKGRKSESSLHSIRVFATKSLVEKESTCLSKNSVKKLDSATTVMDPDCEGESTGLDVSNKACEAVLDSLAVCV